MMPTLSGIDLCKKIRESQHSDYTFFFLITGKKHVRLPVETRLTFTLSSEIRLPG